MVNAVAHPRLERDPESAIVAGVCAALARRLRIDPVLVRVGFGVLVVATAGFALIGYAIAWAAIPAARGDAAAEHARASGWSRPANWRVAAGVGMLTLSLLLVLRELGIWWSDALIWPLILASSGAALLWRQSRAMQPGPEQVEPARTAGEALSDLPAAGTERSSARSRGLADVYRGGFGVALVLGAALLFLYANGALGEARDVVLAVVVATLALGLILAPFLWRLGRNLTAERAERVRSQERAEVAAHLHDSVLQTLTLMQKRADDPRAVAQLARRQERELRSWLFESDVAAQASTAAALRAVAAEVEDAHEVPIEVVAVGDAELTAEGEAIVAAAREAMVNAAKFAPGAGEIAVYAELDGGRAQVFVRDRGPGFDPEAIPSDRRGVRESIVGRMERAGGEARIRSSAGGGTEVELSIATGEAER